MILFKNSQKFKVAWDDVEVRCARTVEKICGPEERQVWNTELDRSRQTQAEKRSFNKNPLEFYEICTPPQTYANHFSNLNPTLKKDWQGFEPVTAHLQDRRLSHQATDHVNHRRPRINIRRQQEKRSYSFYSYLTCIWIRCTHSSREPAHFKHAHLCRFVM